MSGKRRVVEKYDCFGKPYWEIQIKGLFGWRNEFPAYAGFPDTIYYTKEDALRAFEGLNRAETLPPETVIALV